MAKSTNSIWFGINPRGLPYERVVAVTGTAEDTGFEVTAKVKG